MFDRLRLLLAKGTQGVCGGVEEIGVGFQEWCVAGSRRAPGYFTLIGDKAPLVARESSEVTRT